MYNKYHLFKHIHPQFDHARWIPVINYFSLRLILCFCFVSCSHLLSLSLLNIMKDLDK